VITKPLVIVGSLLITVVGAIAVLLATNWLPNWLPVEADLMCVEGRPPNIELGFTDAQGMVPMHITLNTTWKNNGLKRGRVERVELVPEGLRPYPDSVRAVYVDKTEIGWRQTKEIRSEFLVSYQTSRIPEYGDKLYFNTHFYDPGGKEICSRKLQITNIPPPSDWRDRMPKIR
jgi:hypothetical protein